MSVLRDKQGRPLITPPGGTRPVPYMRCTQFIDVLDDTSGLVKWQQRMVAIGVAGNIDLQEEILRNQRTGYKLDPITKEAMQRAGAWDKAETGTALHQLFEDYDNGLEPEVPPEFAADFQAYVTATQHFEPLHIEELTVLDEYRVAGTPDRVVSYNGENFIADVKTGNITYAAGKIAMQLAVYSRSMLFDADTQERTPMPDVNQDNGIVIHLPAGSGEATLHWVDLKAGWEAVQLALEVHNWRKRKNLFTPW